MSRASGETALLDRLLDLLGVGGRSADGATLSELTMKFVTQVPFESISKLYYLQKFGSRTLPDLERYIEGIERFHFGGTCYSNNYYLHLLLEYLGFDVRLCGADMSNPDVHVVNIVCHDGREYLVDAGYAAPFLQPLPCDLDQEHVIVSGNTRYVLSPRDEQRRFRLDLYRDGALTHSYTVNPIQRTIEYFRAAIEDSYRPGATFMNAVLLARFSPDRAVIIHNLTVIEAKGASQTVRRIERRGDLPAEVEKLFAIPRDIVKEAVSELGEFGDAWS